MSTLTNSDGNSSQTEVQVNPVPVPNPSTTPPKKKNEPKGGPNNINPNNTSTGKSKKKKSNNNNSGNSNNNTNKNNNPVAPQYQPRQQNKQDNQYQSNEPNSESSVSSSKQEVTTEELNTQPSEILSEVEVKGNVLNTSWTIWFDGPKTRHDTTLKYEDRLIQIGTFSTVEEFFRYYVYLKRPLELGNENCNFHIFRTGLKPMWEAFPKGGCFIKKIRKPEENEYRNLLGRMWEELLIAAIGEAFEDMDVVGVVLSIRPKEDFLCVWNKSRENAALRNKICDKLREIWHLDSNTVIEYKPHSKSIKDGSTYRAGKPFHK